MPEEASPLAKSNADLFLRLTPEKVLEAVETSGFKTTGLCYPLNSFENRVYEVELVDRSRVIAKFYRPGRWSHEQILDEHEFLDELAAEEIPVVPMRRFPSGETLQEIEGIFYCLADRRGGRAPDELTEENATRLGRLIARIHNVGARHPAPHRLTLSAQLFIRENLRFLAEREAIPAHLEARYLEAANGLAEAVDRAMEGVAIHRIHGDLHLGNLLLRDGLLHIVDFDDMVMGPAVQDLWLSLPGRDATSLALREQLLFGYEQFRALDRASLSLAEPLRGLRLIHYAAWIARRWHDPAFPAAWPWFGTVDYWTQETETLEEQLAVVRGLIQKEEEAANPDAERAPQEEEVTLTNKDFFWDWEGSDTQSEQGEVPTPNQRVDLDERLEALERDGSDELTWEDVVKEARASLKAKE